MRFIGVFLVAMLVSPITLGQSSPGAGSPGVDLFVGARDGEVRLLWIPTVWKSTFEGFIIKRRAEDGAWEQLGGLIALPESVRTYFLERPNGLIDLRRELLEDPTYAHKSGFAYVDRTIPRKAPSRSYEYAIHLVEHGTPKTEPSDTASWDTEYEVDLDIGLRSADNLWDEQGVATFAKVNARQLSSKAVGFRIIEHRGAQSRDRYNLIRPNPHLLEWEYLCYEAKAPYPDAISFVVEDHFGFHISATSKIDERAPKTQRNAVPSRKCWEPVIVSVDPRGQSMPSEPPAMHWVGPLATRQ